MHPHFTLACLSTELIQTNAKKYPRTIPSTRVYEYGTAGFRMNASFMDSAAYRMGLLSVLKSRSTQATKTLHYFPTKDSSRPSTLQTFDAIGIMITASHNAAPDNGLKMIDRDGGMLEAKWEVHARHLANVPEDEVYDTLLTIAKLENLTLPPPSSASSLLNHGSPSSTTEACPQAPVPLIMIAYDSRSSSPHLASLVKQGVLDMGGMCVDYGYATTPQLHFYVGECNNKSIVDPPRSQVQHINLTDDIVSKCPFLSTRTDALRLFSSSRGDFLNNFPKNQSINVFLPMPRDYTSIYQAYCDLIRTKTHPTTTPNNDILSNDTRTHLVIDCANGIGGMAVAECISYIENEFKSSTKNDSNSEIFTPEIVAVNNPFINGVLNTDMEVNLGCGAEYVHRARLCPAGMQAHLDQHDRCASVDGDCDRLVYFIANEDEKEGDITVIDGDKIAVLFAATIKQWLAEAEIEGLKLGMVQTPYANGASTKYAQSLDIPITVSHTGVKHLHHKAKSFDIGVYFEANGHGTVLFSATARSLIDQKYQEIQSSKCDNISTTVSTAVSRLKMLMSLINSSIGDALSDILAVEALLYLSDLSIHDLSFWYSDVTSKLDKVVISNRNLVVVDDEREDICVKPLGLQDAIDTLIIGLRDPNARAFVRPSGTEDIVRIYAEASDLSKVEYICEKVQKLVKQYVECSK